MKLLILTLVLTFGLACGGGGGGGSSSSTQSDSNEITANSDFSNSTFFNAADDKYRIGDEIMLQASFDVYGNEKTRSAAAVEMVHYKINGLEVAIGLNGESVTVDTSSFSEGGTCQ